MCSQARMYEINYIDQQSQDKNRCGQLAVGVHSFDWKYLFDSRIVRRTVCESVSSRVQKLLQWVVAIENQHALHESGWINKQYIVLRSFLRRCQIPVILSGIDEKFQTWRQVMGELRQHHPSLRISKVKALKKGDLLVVGDSPQDALILQSEPKMKAALGKNVRVSLPKAYQIAKQTNKCLVVKGVPTDIIDDNFKEFLDLNKISYAKAERYKSKKNGRVLPMFQLKISDPAEAEALLSQNLMCNVTGIVYKVEEFRQPVSVRQCFNCQCFGHSAQNCKSKQKCVICGENHSHKGCPKKEAKQPKCANCAGPHVASYKGCPEYKKQAFRQHVVNHQKSYAAVVSQNSHSQPKNTQTFQFTAEQLTKFVANVVIQIAQPQVCYPNPKQDMLDLKSSMCRKVSNVAKTILGVNVTGKELFESSAHLAPLLPPGPLPLRAPR